MTSLLHPQQRAESVPHPPKFHRTSHRSRHLTGWMEPHRTPSPQPSLESRAGASHPDFPLHCGAAATETPRGAKADASVETGTGRHKPALPKGPTTKPRSQAVGRGRPWGARLGQRLNAPRGSPRRPPTREPFPGNRLVCSAHSKSCAPGKRAASAARFPDPTPVSEPR